MNGRRLLPVWRSVAASGLACALLSSCADFPSASPPAKAVTDPDLVLATTVPALTFITERLSDGFASVRDYSELTIDMHDIVIPTEHIRGVDMVFTVHEDFQRGALRELHRIDVPVTYVGEQFDLRDAPPSLPDYDTSDPFPDPVHVKRDAQMDVDPHFWMDPSLMIEATHIVHDELLELAPEHKDLINERAGKLISELAVLDKDIDERMLSCQGSLLVTNHDSFWYWKDAYKVDVMVVPEIANWYFPDDVVFDKVRERLPDDRVAFFYTAEVEQRYPFNVERKLGVPATYLDGLAGKSRDWRRTDYVNIMRDNVDRVTTAWGC